MRLSRVDSQPEWSRNQLSCAPQMRSTLTLRKSLESARRSCSRERSRAATATIALLRLSGLRNSEFFTDDRADSF